MKRLILALIFLLLPVSTWSGTITAANGGGNWSAGGTWIGGVVPDPVTDTAVIPETLTAAVILDDSRTIPVTTIEDEVYGLVQGSGITTTLGGVLTVGNGTSKDGKFTFGAGSTLALGSNNFAQNNCYIRSNATANNWAIVNGTGAFVKGSNPTYPKIDITISYVSFQNTGAILFPISYGTGVATPKLIVHRCVFDGVGAITIGYVMATSAELLITNNDFRNLTGNIIIAGTTGTATGARVITNE